MTDALDRLIMREAGNGGGGRAKRTKGPKRRPPYTAHPVSWWDAETTAAHLAACRSGRGPDGEWRPWDELSQTERWVWFWEYSVIECNVVVGGGEVVPTEVP